MIDFPSVGDNFGGKTLTDYYLMKIGVSSYSLIRAIRSGELSWDGALEWTKENGGEHFEVVSLEPAFGRDEAFLDAIRTKAAALDLPLSSYTVGANFLKESEAEIAAEIERVKGEVDAGARLGVKFMRHDAGSRPVEQTGTAQFEADFPTLVRACREVADYAAQYGITTSVENHGYHVQASERVHRLVLAVDRPNFRTTLDVGNFLCADEDSLAAVKNNIGIASMVHFKDFYRRSPRSHVGEGWFPTRAGYKLRGAIVGNGDIDLPSVVRVIHESGFDGFISVEFEGKEPCLEGTRTGLDNLRRLFAEAAEA